jgi:hypothetical protein
MYFSFKRKSTTMTEGSLNRHNAPLTSFTYKPLQRCGSGIKADLTYFRIKQADRSIGGCFQDVFQGSEKKYHAVNLQKTSKLLIKILDPSKV